MYMYVCISDMNYVCHMYTNPLSCLKIANSVKLGVATKRTSCIFILHIYNCHF